MAVVFEGWAYLFILAWVYGLVGAVRAGGRPCSCLSLSLLLLLAVLLLAVALLLLLLAVLLCAHRRVGAARAPTRANSGAKKRACSPPFAI